VLSQTLLIQTFSAALNSCPSRNHYEMASSFRAAGSRVPAGVCRRF
jgi:hypothetical protein